MKTVEKHTGFHPNRKNWLIVAFIMLFPFPCARHVCLGEEGKSENLHNYLRSQSQEVNRFIYDVFNVSPDLRDKNAYLTAENHSIVFAVVINENRFIARGTITNVQRAPKGIQKFTLHIKKTERYKEYANFGGTYVGKEAEILSEVGIPPSFQSGADVSVLLRVSGDEWGQYLFLVEAIDNETKN